MCVCANSRPNRKRDDTKGVRRTYSSGAGEGAKPHDMNVGAIDAVRAIGTVLREHSGLVARDQREVDGGAESGSRRGVDEPARIDLDVVREAVLLGSRRQQDFEELAVLEGHDQLE